MTSNHKYTRINGVPGFGFPGEKGDSGKHGQNTFVSELYYENDRNTTVPDSIFIPFEDNLGTLDTNKYVLALNCWELSEEDVFLVSGDHGTNMYKIIKDGDDIYISSKKVTSSRYDSMPSFSVLLEASKKFTDISVSVTIESDNIDYFYELIAETITTSTNAIGRTKTIVNGGRTSITIKNAGAPRVYVFALYRTSPMSYKKIFLGSTEILS